MNCEDFGKYLDNYENLTVSEKSQMLDHADMCEKCKAELDFFLSMISTVNALPKMEPPADFMDKLNTRLDAEDKRVVSASKIVYHFRRNWKQYAAAAACLALVTVITANRSILIDRYVENDGAGIISEETASTNSDADPSESSAPIGAADTQTPAQPAETPQSQQTTPPAAAPAANETPSASRSASAPSTSSTAAPASTARRSAQTATAAPASTPSQSSSAAQAATTAPATASGTEAAQSQQTPASEVTERTQAQETAGTPQPAAAQNETANTSTSKTNSGGDYGIAHVSDSTASVAYDLRVEDVKASLDASEIKSNYSLAEGGEEIAYGRYYTLDRNGNPISSASGIGSIKISSEDAELAMEIIDRYPHDEDGNIYTTDSVNLTRILSKLKSEGVSFTDYTLGDTGEVKFKVIFN